MAPLTVTESPHVTTTDLCSHHAGNVAVLTEQLAQRGDLDMTSPGRGGEVWPGGETSHSQQSGALISLR